MLESDYAHAAAKKKGVGLHYSQFQKLTALAPTTCENKTPENRQFRSRIAEVGLTTFTNSSGEVSVRDSDATTRSRSFYRIRKN